MLFFTSGGSDSLYQLEIKSMINKMRVAGVRESDDAELQNRIKELTDKNAGLTRILEEKDSEIADLSSRLKQCELCVRIRK